MAERRLYCKSIGWYNYNSIYNYTLHKYHENFFRFKILPLVILIDFRQFISSWAHEAFRAYPLSWEDDQSLLVS
jgi:hypothetical protein